MKCISCGKDFHPSLLNLRQCKECQKAEWMERRSVNWFKLTSKQALAKDTELDRKYTKYKDAKE